MTSLMALLDFKQYSLVVSFIVFFGAASVVQLVGFAGVDGFIGKDALTVVAASPVMLLQASLSILTLLLAAAAIVIGDSSLMGVGVWAWAILGAYAFSVWKISGAQGRKPRIAENEDGSPAGAADNTDNTEQAASSAGNRRHGALTPVVVKTVIAAVTILAAGFLLSQAADAIAAQSGLGQSFVGAVLLGILLTTIYLIGLIERRNRTIARMGVDSLAILASYGGGLVLLYQLR